LPTSEWAMLFCSAYAQHVVSLALLDLDDGVHGLDHLGEVGVAVVLGIEGRVEALDHVPHGSPVDPGLALGFGEQAHGALEHLGGRVSRRRWWAVLGFAGLGRFFGAGCFDQAVVVAELVAALGSVLVGVDH
jgi:hypothetical protein